MSKDSGYSKEWIKQNYDKYLKSAHWQDVRRRYKASKLHKDACYACGTSEGLQLHHKTYKRVGRERLNDLLYLCGDCHSKVHQVLRDRASGKTTLFNVAKKLRKIIKKRGKKRALLEW
jgi:5-methylcytosine-specific restriction endonuclease McrA